ncbi:hypothetical protein PV396_10225 [Streptomyces sp. ME02-8801-2C]|uniref:hypothetical protein n=1 Tax=Streptomyces sp. ME02-8801-2C TaxID=3028680 RepID=UPI0029A31E3B|nr:hypothetical protein [Streptomyces sp. ME02-8801-2C]MDX3452314.1 hypothetical protein [Streptomyces sp. ME02-8801-2C]
MCGLCRVYGIFFDHCSLLAAPEVELVQREMERINRWLLDYLTERGWAKRATFYSERSFLRDAVDVRPGPAPKH